MFTFNPGEVPATKSSMEFVASLLAVLADPKQATDHLAQMQEKLDAIATADAALRVAAAQAQADHDHAAADLASREVDLANRESTLADIAAAQADADRRIAAAKDAEAHADIATAALIERETGVQQLERAAAIRNRELDTRSASLDDRASALSAQEADYQARINKLKAMVN